MTATKPNNSFLPQLVFPLSPLLSSSELISEDPRIVSAQPTLSQSRSQSLKSKPVISKRDTFGLSISSSNKTLSTQDILSILDLLEQADYDVVCEVERIKEDIKEARTQLQTYRTHKKMRDKENIAEMVVEKRETRKRMAISE